MKVVDEWCGIIMDLRFGSKPKCVLFMPGDQRWVYDLSVPSTVPNSATSDCFHLRPSFLSFLDLIVTLGTSTSPSICVKWFHRLWHFDCLLYWSYSALGDQNIDHERPPVHTHRAECIASSVVPGTSHHRFCILGPFTHRCNCSSYLNCIPNPMALSLWSCVDHLLERTELPFSLLRLKYSWSLQTQNQVELRDIESKAVLDGWNHCRQRWPSQELSLLRATFCRVTVMMSHFVFYI